MPPESRYTSESDLESVVSTAEPKKSGHQPTAKKYVCTTPGCGQTFRRMVHLDRHEYKHTGIKKHGCFHEGCSKTYTIITHLKRHIKVSHEKTLKTKDVKCSFDFCDKKFASVFSMERHIREIHHNPKVYKCEHCDETFKQRIKLRRHEVTHTGEFPFNCSKCCKGFVQEYFFKRHICRVYTCNQCTESFNKWSKLLAHRKAANHKATLYKCEVCNKQYSSKYELSEHSNIHSDDKEVYPCPEEGCQRFYSYRRNLLQHIRSVHNGEKLSCTVVGCQALLATKKCLKNHINVVHSDTSKAKKQSTKTRAKRKDAGKRKRSTLSKMSGVLLGKEIDKMVMEGCAEIEVDYNAIDEEISMGTDEEADEKAEEQHLVILAVKDS